MFGYLINYLGQPLFEAITRSDEARVKEQFRTDKTPIKQLRGAAKQARLAEIDRAGVKAFFKK